MTKNNDNQLNVAPEIDAIIEFRAEAEALATASVLTMFDVPIRIFIDESTEIGRRVEMLYSSDPETNRPGFERVAFRIPKQTPHRVEQLVTAAREMNLRVILGKSRYSSGMVKDFEAGESVLATLKRTLGFFYDDGQETPEDAELAALAHAHDGADSVAEVSAALYDYGRLAQRDNSALKVIDTWDETLPERALELASILAGPPPEVDKKDLDLRNRFLTLLTIEIRKIKRAAEFLFTDKHTDIYRSYFTSTYLRNRRLAAARAKANANAKGSGA